MDLRRQHSQIHVNSLQGDDAAKQEKKPTLAIKEGAFRAMHFPSSI